MKRNVLRLMVGFGLATGLLGLFETVAAAEPRVGLNHSAPER